MKFRVLTYANQFVDETRLCDGIYFKAVPTLHNVKATIETRIEMAKTMANLMPTVWTPDYQKAYEANLRKCAFKTVTISID